MKETTLPTGAGLERTRHAGTASADNQWRWNFAAFFCFTGSVSLAVGGLFLSGADYFIQSGGVNSNAGIRLIYAAFPLMLCGSHALDKSADAEKKK